MILALAATEIEMAPFLMASSVLETSCRTLVTGVGPVETALRLTRFIALCQDRIDCAVLFGVGGAYLQADQDRQPKLLDICLAEQEVAGDFGICLGDSMAYLDSSLTGEIVYPLNSSLLDKCRAVFSRLAIDHHLGVFITVNGATGTAARGEMLRLRWNGLCENMEGAAVARVCREFHLPFIELRCISNLVQDRDPATWQLEKACQKAAHTAVQLLQGLML